MYVVIDEILFSQRRRRKEMRKIKKLSVLAAVLVVISMFLASCGSPLKNDPAVGNWEMTSVDYAGQTLSAEDLKATGAMDEMPTFEIREDGTCTFSFMDNSGEGEVTANGDNTYELTDDSDMKLTFEISGDELELNYADMDMIMIFEK